MELTAKVVRVVPTVERGGKPIDKIHVEYAENPSYPQVLEFEAYNKPDIFASVSPGDTISISYDLRGREWDGDKGLRVFNTLSCFKIQVVEKAASSPSTSSPSATSLQEDDLPF